MEVAKGFFQSSFTSTSTSRILSCCIGNQPCDHGVETNTKLGSLTITRVMGRRLVLEVMGFNSLLILGVGVADAAPTTAVKMKELPKLNRSLKLPSGVQIEEIVEGEGSKAQEGDLVEINYACRRFNGFFMYSTVDQFSGESTPVILPLVKDQIIQGLKEVLIGMRVGGKRRALIPPSVGYVSESLQPMPKEFGPRRKILSHLTEPIVFEVQLLKVL